MAGIFLFQQVAWAGDLIDAALSQQYKEQSQTFSPQYLQSQQIAVETLVSQKQDALDYAKTFPATASANNTAVRRKRRLSPN